MSCTACQAPLRPDVNFCTHCGAATRAVSRCASCDGVVLTDDNYCGRCGARLKSLDVPVQATSDAGIATRGVTVELELPAPGTDPDLETTIRSGPGFVEVPGPEGQVGRVTFGPSETAALIEFVERTDTRRGRRVYRDGQRQPWDEFFRFLDCFRERRRSTNPSEYCFYDDANNPNVWGCFQVRMPLGATTIGSEWLMVGSFENDGSFVFDKKAVIAQLDQRLAPFRLCPALEVRYVGQALRAFPARVNPKVNRDWRYVEDPTGKDPGAVTALRREAGAAVEVKVRGVVPASPEAAERTAEAVRRAVAAAQNPAAAEKTDPGGAVVEGRPVGSGSQS
jgi:hypothetical protein